jgi:hypothetical protein
MDMIAGGGIAKGRMTECHPKGTVNAAVLRRTFA